MEFSGLKGIGTAFILFMLFVMQGTPALAGYSWFPVIWLVVSALLKVKNYRFFPKGSKFLLLEIWITYLSTIIVVGWWFNFVGIGLLMNTILAGISLNLLLAIVSSHKR